MLYLIPTPIGNLGDITSRSVAVLQEVDVILAEDTRNSGRLLKHLGVSTPMLSYHAHNEHKKTADIIDQLKDGRKIGLISDAGTPAISDPGFLLVRACIQNDINISCLPGPNALIPALAISGIPCDRFYFEGFLPHKKGRQTRWQTLAQLNCTIALYESPHRLLKALNECLTFLGPDRYIAVIKEISKIYESVYRGSPEQLIEQFKEGKVKGEYVIVIAAKGYDPDRVL